MMTPIEIENGIGEYLRNGLPGRTIVWPNQDADPDRPFVVFDHIPVSRTDDTWSGGDIITRGSVMITIVIERNKFTAPANVIANDVFSLFQYPTSIITDNGLIIINKPPELETGYRDGADWRLPIRVDYQTKE
jgi:hypothetical protein